MKDGTNKGKWDYRMVSWKKSGMRLYGIAEVYSENGKFTKYFHDEKLHLNYIDIGELVAAMKSLRKAFKKPIIDIDNFPNDL